MIEKNISPKVAPSVYSIMERMKRMGLTEDDMVTLIRRHVGDRKITRIQVQQTLKALKRIEKNFLESSNR